MISKIKAELCNKLINGHLVKEYDVIGHSYTDNGTREPKDCIASDNGIMPTLTTRPDVLGVVVMDKEYIACEIRTDEGIRTFNDNNVGTLRTIDGCGCKHVIEKDDNLRIRKLTPKECFRLQGVKDSDFENVAKGASDANLYHLAGDSICVNVLCAIFKQML